jgi:Zn finger protein HypA/HybF involved in hydrogenase expression
MHEMGIAASVLDAVHQELHRYAQGLGVSPEAGAQRVALPRAAKVGLRIGEFAGVDGESLRFCFEAQVKGTELEPLELEITWCRAEDGWRGDELELAYLELEDAQQAREAAV